MNNKKDRKYVPEYENDALSEILSLLNLDVSIYHNAKVCGDWQINEHRLGATCFHIVTLGHCVLSVPGLFDDRLECGDLVVFPRELAHSMRPEKAQTGKQRHLAFQESEDIYGTGILCGEIRFQHKGCRYLLNALPPLFIIKYSQGGAWLQSLLKMIIDENHNISMASKVVLDKLTELLFTYALRQYLLDNPDKTGIFSIYAHPRIAKAVSAIHKHPEKNWTLELMAKEAMLSRTAFAETFKALSGWTAGQYLTWWRMQLAWHLLKRGENIAQVSNKAGYRSESSFSRAFKKIFGISAGKVRKL
ncbi:Transcriptional regulator, AraC family [hydrothermal vent metagenome]|uniref:Transcriptional regulator, AraC family n=1 Tax=hydrothermal vent metagenome TaxID=652676 RepID=A0A3B0X8R1_9ZZZZ